ncbi:glycoside hydrolase family 18 protein [Mycena sp. CBHHK59/15]|nr:glycoside hydrolase family 18 protein [Mycena sp. CBHHK59/15]
MCHLRILLVLLSFLTAALTNAKYRSFGPPGALTALGLRQTPSTNSSDNLDTIASAWYPGWLSAQFPPSSLSWGKYNAMTFAFATTTPSVSNIALDDVSATALPKFVENAQKHGVKALLSIGGWTGSMYYSTAVATAENRTAFVSAVLGLVSKYNLDGIDFDWEYPGRTTGLQCNKEDSNDSANFLLFLQELRNSSAGHDLVLTVAVGTTPFAGADGQPMQDVSEFGKVLDRIALMVYDVWGSWSPSVGPNAPLNDSCATAADRMGSAASAVNSWMAAKFPANQITLGVAAYGHSYSVAPSAALSGSELTSYPAFDASAQPMGTSDTSGDTSLDPCGNRNGISGLFTFAGLISSGFLNSTGSAAEGIDYRFDSCSQTPYVYNSTSKVMVSYDDDRSFAAKGKFIDDQGLLGFSMWDATGDQNDILIDSLTRAMGIEADCR